MKPTKKGPRYTPVSRRQDRPNAILWLLRNHPELKDAQIMRLVGTTKSTIQQIRERTHWNSSKPVAARPGDPRPLLADRPRFRGAARGEGPAAARPARRRPDASAGRGHDGAPEPVQETFAPSPAAAQPAPAEDEIDVNSVFAKLKQLKRPDQGEDG